MVMMEAEDFDNRNDDAFHPQLNQIGKIDNLVGRLQAPLIDSHERYDSKHIGSIEEDTAAASDTEGDITSMLGIHGRLLRGSNPLTQTILDMQKKLSSLEKQLESASKKRPGPHELTSDLTLPQQHDDHGLSEQVPVNEFKHSTVVPELRERTWEDFMNKFEDDACEYAIEVCVDDPGYKTQSKRSKSLHNTLLKEVKQEAVSGTNSTRSSPVPEEEIAIVPDRIRINSPKILSQLATIDRSIDSTEPLLMLRPFKFLVHFEERIRNIVAQLHNNTRNAQNDFSRAEIGNGGDDLVQHLGCLLQFIDKYIIPTVTRLKLSTVGKVAFRDLWYIFQPGDEIFMPLKDKQHRMTLNQGNVTPEMLQGRYERTWRVIGTGGGRQSLSTAQGRDTRKRQNAFEVHCYFVDFDGISFCPVVHTFSIPPFSGQRDVALLDFFPTRFLQQSKELWDRSWDQCKMVFNALLRSPTHFYYRGPTLVTQPCGCPLGIDGAQQELVESEVIVDYRATLLKHPLWRPQPSFWRKPPHYPDELQEKSRVHYWADKLKSKLARTEVNQVYDDTLIDKEKALVFRDSARIFNLNLNDGSDNANAVCDSDVMMLSTRVYGFVLRTRSFAPLWLWGLQRIDAQSDGLRNLQLRDNSLKETIHALVRTHFLQMQLSKQSEGNYDMVRGKGKGLIFLLHGSPGVGKTFTAESVAAANGRPLFQITCGDLGLTPSEVEKALKEIFRYAQLWNCVLLLDECDIFLTQRTKTDMKRNSLVSVFLRVLEYYGGVLFLTTNRVGALDSAVMSRVTLSTLYPPLNLDQTREIWKANLDLEEKRNPNREIDRRGILKFAKEHFLATIKNESNWNGRQIQNAFKVAVSLTDWDALSNEQQHATDLAVVARQRIKHQKLTAHYFGVVAVAAEAFNDYLHETTGMTEERRAFFAQERADNYGNEEEVKEETETLQVPNSPVKKRRTSSTASAMQQVHFSPSYAHSSSSPNSQQPLHSRRASGQQPSLNKSWLNGNTQLKNPSPNFPAVKMPAPYSHPLYERGPPSKRKRSDSEQIRATNNVRASPQQPGDTGSGSDSEYAVDGSAVVDNPAEGSDWE